MIQFHPCTIDDHAQTIALIVTTFKPPMLEEFPLLLGTDNLSHMWIAKDDQHVVAVVNYYITPVHLDDVTLSIASIGAVATHPDYRGRGLSSQLLQLAEAQMKAEGVDIVVISGDLPHYRRYGADQISLMDTFTIPPRPSSVVLRPYTPMDLHVCYEFYQRQRFRYGRSLAEMKSLIDAALTPDPWWDTHVDVIARGHERLGYMVYAIEKNHTTAYIHELVSQPLDAVAACHALYQRHPHLTDVVLELIHNDPLGATFRELGYSVKRDTLEHTSKIVRFNQVLEKLQPYFTQRAQKDVFHFQEHHGVYSFSINQHSFETKSLSVAQAIVMGPLPSEVHRLPIAKDLERYFPIPFVYPHNLNYQ